MFSALEWWRELSSTERLEGGRDERGHRALWAQQLGAMAGQTEGAGGQRLTPRGPSLAAGWKADYVGFCSQKSGADFAGIVRDADFLLFSLVSLMPIQTVGSQGQGSIHKIYYVATKLGAKQYEFAVIYKFFYCGKIYAT